MSQRQIKLKLPAIRRVRLKRFSLFAANPDVDFSCTEGVMCLVGANGIGKSTLLSAVNYCLTGIVSDPTRTFESMDEYYKFTRGYSSTYFRGRVSGGDEDDADITLNFSIGDFDYEIRRGLFEPEELRDLFIVNRTTGDRLVETDDMARSQRHCTYTSFLVQHTGLNSFDEFAFLQHFVFTFDEQRRTLFWSPRIMERVLYRAFGLDPSMAKQADAIRREIQHEDSKVRNRQWEATRMRRRINEIRAQAQQNSGARERYDMLSADHESLSNQFDEHSRALKEAEDALRDANLYLANQSVRETALRDEYATFFDRHFDKRPPVARHPLIVQSLASRECGLCGSVTKKSHDVIAAKAEGPTCPLCDALITLSSDADEHAATLREIDSQLLRVRKLISDTHKRIEHLNLAAAEARTNWQDTKEALDRFEQENGSTLDSLRRLLSREPTQAPALKEYRDQLTLIDEEKKDAQVRRDSLKTKLARLQRDLERHYIQVENRFVPAFSSLAQQFLGMPLSVEMDARPADDVKLVVTVRGTTRRLQHNLSESQRFFLDIALRMALTQHMSDPSSPGGMFIDTPEGSLDIAYEKRAGDMLAMFASAGHHILMTANLNSSQLLLALAHTCGRKRLQLCRMTDWAELSEVQQQEEALFDRAYRDIEAAMDAGAAKHAT